MEQNVRDAIHAIEAAIYNSGPVPQVHTATMKRHREEWPTLWAAIDQLLAAVDRA